MDFRRGMRYDEDGKALLGSAPVCCGRASRAGPCAGKGGDAHAALLEVAGGLLRVLL